MILFFGPAGSGKSVQGQILGARPGWRWISTGELLRDTHDPDISRTINAGNLISSDQMNKVITEALQQAIDIKHVVLDGYPRKIEQAQWLVENLPKHERSISLAIVLIVPRIDIDRRMALRGRLDDTLEAIDKRLNVYRQTTSQILAYLAEQHVPVVQVDASGTIDQVHDKIQAQIDAVVANK